MTTTVRQAFCTISTVSHAHKTRALISSVKRFMPEIDFVVLWVDGNLQVPGADNLTLDEISVSPIAQQLVKKYARKTDEHRWSLKPVLLGHLLQQNYHSVIYLDNDLYFYSDPSFLMKLLQEHSVLLCPHWRINNPMENKAWFHVNFTDGVYNAGFVGASQDGKDAMQWWVNCCLYACEKNFKKGLFDDQKYLDLLPAEFENVGILQHRGCNVAYWNVYNHKLAIENNTVIVNGKWPLIFVHYTAKLEQDIAAGKLPVLHDLWTIYQESLKQ